VTKDELLKKEVEEYISSTPNPGPKDFIVYKVKIGENAFTYVVEHKGQLSFSDWVKMYEGTERDCYRAVGYLYSADRINERMEKLEKENELFKKANEIIAQQRDGRDADISVLETCIEELEQKLEQETSQRIYNFNKAIEWKEKYRALKKEAKAIMDIGVEAVKHYSVVGGRERPFLKEAEMLFNLFFDKADRFLSEDKDENTSNQEGSNEQDL